MTPEEARIRARVLELERERSQQKPSVMQNVGSEVMKGMTQGGPPAALVRGLAAGVPSLSEWENEQITSGAYKVGGMATDLASKAGASPEVSGGVGVAANMAAQAIPTVVGGEVSKILTSPTLQWMGKKAMRMALVPPQEARLSGKADRVVKTMLDEGVNVTKGGVEKMQSRIAALDKQIDDVIKSSRSTLDKTKILKRLEEVKSRYQFSPGDVRKGAEAEIKAAGKAFANQPEIAGSNRIPIQTAQKLKQGYQKSVGDKGYGGVRTPTIESEKAIGRALREDISTAAPVVGPLNARSKGLIDAVSLAKRRVGMGENASLLGIAPLAHNPTAFVAMLAEKWSLTKSAVAHILYGAPRPLGQAVGAGAGLLSDMGEMP